MFSHAKTDRTIVDAQNACAKAISGEDTTESERAFLAGAYYALGWAIGVQRLTPAAFAKDLKKRGRQMLMLKL